jgi:Asp-tRNA(Asn)/Glu-tRNA(Gln) amidotransferase A subunit family amidase
LGDTASSVELGSNFDCAIDMHRTVMEVEMAYNFHRDYEQGRDKLSPVLRQLIERGRAAPAMDYMRAASAVGPLNSALDPVFDEYDAILTPAAPGPAPKGLASTGNPVFCSIWSYLGTPAISLPLLQSEEGLPIGVQLVARRGNDAKLLRTAAWLAKTLQGGRSAPRKRRPRQSSKRNAS